MKTKKCYRAWAILLAFTLLLSAAAVPLTGYAEEQPGPELYQILTISTERPACMLPLYKIDGAYYMEAEDIASLSRYTAEMQDGSILLKQGVREITIDPVNRTATDNCGGSFSCPAKKAFSEWVLPAVPMLKYLGVSCEYSDSVFQCSVPDYTFFEIWDNDIFDCYMDPYKLYGDNLESNLTCAVIMDMIFGQGLSGVVHGGNAYIVDALDEILMVDISKRDSISEEYERVSNRRSLSYSLDELPEMDEMTQVLPGVEKKIYQAMINLLETGNQIYDIGLDVDDYITCILQSKKFQDLYKYKYDKTLTDNEIVKRFREGMKSKLTEGTINLFFTLSEIICISKIYTGYSTETRQIFKKVFGQEQLERIHYDTAPIATHLSVIDKYSTMLENDKNIVEAVSTQTMLENLVDYSIDACVEALIYGVKQTVGLGIKLLKFGWDSGVFVMRFLGHNTVESAASELKAMFIGELQGITADILSQCIRECNQTCHRKLPLTQQLIDTTALFYREGVAFCDNILNFELLTADQEAYFRSIQAECEKKLFQLSNCADYQIPVYVELTDNVLEDRFDGSSLALAVPDGDMEEKTVLPPMTCGYALEANGDLYYMRFDKDSFNSLSYILYPDFTATYDLVKRSADGSETVLDHVTGKNLIGLCNDNIIYSTNADGSGSIYQYSPQTESLTELGWGTLYGVTHSAIASFDPKEWYLSGYNKNGEKISIGNETYIGMDDQYIYSYFSNLEPLAIHGTGTLTIYRTDVNSAQREEVAVLPQIDTENPTSTSLLQFMSDDDANYFSLGALSGTRGLISDGIIYRVPKGTNNVEVMVKHALPYFQLIEENGKKCLLYNFNEENAPVSLENFITDVDGADRPHPDTPAQLIDIETGEYAGDTSDGYAVPSPTGTSVWNPDGIHAFLDRTGTYYTVLTPEELAQYGFTDYDSFNYRASDISVQESGVYIYLCRGGSREAGMYAVDYGVLLKKNLETGELTMIYEM